MKPNNTAVSWTTTASLIAIQLTSLALIPISSEAGLLRSHSASNSNTSQKRLEEVCQEMSVRFWISNNVAEKDQIKKDLNCIHFLQTGKGQECEFTSPDLKALVDEAVVRSVAESVSQVTTTNNSLLLGMSAPGSCSVRTSPPQSLESLLRGSFYDLTQKLDAGKPGDLVFEPMADIFPYGHALMVGEVVDKDTVRIFSDHMVWGAGLQTRKRKNDGNWTRLAYRVSNEKVSQNAIEFANLHKGDSYAPVRGVKSVVTKGQRELSRDVKADLVRDLITVALLSKLDGNQNKESLKKSLRSKNSDICSTYVARALFLGALKTKMDNSQEDAGMKHFNDSVENILHSLQKQPPSSSTSKQASPRSLVNTAVDSLLKKSDFLDLVEFGSDRKPPSPLFKSDFTLMTPIALQPYLQGINGSPCQLIQ